MQLLQFLVQYYDGEITDARFKDELMIIILNL